MVPPFDILRVPRDARRFGWKRQNAGGRQGASRIETIAWSESHLPVPLQINNIFACLTATTRARRLKAVVF